MKIPATKIPFETETEEESRKKLLTKEIRRMLGGEFDKGMELRKDAKPEGYGRGASPFGAEGYGPSYVNPEEESYLAHLKRIEALQNPDQPILRMPNLGDYNPVSGEFESDMIGIQTDPKQKKFRKLRKALGKKSFFNADTEDYEFEK